MFNCKEMVKSGASDCTVCDDTKNRNESYIETWIHYFPIVA